MKPHGVEHHILTEGSPKFSPPRRLPPEKLKFAKEEFKLMEQGKIADLRAVLGQLQCTWYLKRNKILRDFVVTIVSLISITIPDHYPLPHIQDFTSALHGKNIFSKIDLVKAYYQVPVAKKNIPKTAVTTPFGLFEFLVIPFDLRNAAQTFQRLMNSLLNDLSFAFCYLDDILIVSKDEKEHIAHLRIIFDRLQRAEHDYFKMPFWSRRDFFSWISRFK